MNPKREKIFREAVAALIGSKLRSTELRLFAEWLKFDDTFARDFGRVLHDVSYGLEPQEEIPWPEEMGQSEEKSFGGLLDLAYRVTQRRRLSKDKLISIFRSVAPGIRWSASSRDSSVRELIATFLERSSTSETQEFLNALGLVVGDDPYLAGVSSRSRK